MQGESYEVTEVKSCSFNPYKYHSTTRSIWTFHKLWNLRTFDRFYFLFH